MDLREVSVYQLRSPHGIETWVWLCPECLQIRKAAKWEEIVGQKVPQKLLCEDCET
jgi:hypothetical protein